MDEDQSQLDSQVSKEGNGNPVSKRARDSRNGVVAAFLQKKCDKFVTWVEKVTLANCSETAACISDRWIVYRFLDWLLSRIYFRHLPSECCIDEYSHVPPFPQASDKPTAWQSLYDNAIRLAMHDDQLNWQKYHYMIVLNLGMMTAYGVLYSTGRFAGYIIIPVFGLIFAFLFDRTLQEGMRCLRSHRQKIKALDSKLFTQPNREFMFSTNPYNQRDALELGPLFLFAMWFLVLLFSLLYPAVVAR